MIFLIDDNLSKQLQRLVDNAQANRLTIETLDRNTENKTAVGDDPRFVADLPFGWRIVFSIEEARKADGSGAVWMRHMSLSVSGDGKLPNVMVTELIAKELGFPGFSEKKCHIYFEQAEHLRAVNIISKI
jgi:hypothetical protein